MVRDVVSECTRVDDGHVHGAIEAEADEGEVHGGWEFIEGKPGGGTAA